MTDKPARKTARSVPTRTFTADSGTARRMTGTFLPVRLSRPAFLAVLGIALAAIIGYGFLIGQALLFGVILFLAIVVLVVLMTTLELFVTFRRTYRAGTKFTASWGAESVTMTTPLGSSTIPYSKLDRVYVRGSGVVLRTSAPRMNVALPSELVDPDVLTRLPGRHQHR